MSYAQPKKHNFNNSSYNSSYNLTNSKYIYSHENAVRDIIKSINTKYNPIINTYKTSNNYGDYFKINIIIHLSKYEEFVKINICASSLPNSNSIISVRVNDTYAEDIYNLDLIKFKLKTHIFKDTQEHEHLNIQFNIENNDQLNIKIENMLAILEKIHDHLEALQQVDNGDNIENVEIQTTPQLMPVVTKFYASVMTSLSDDKLDNPIINVPVVVNTPAIINVPVVVNTPEIINVPVVVNTPAIINVPVVVNTPVIIDVPVVVNTPEIINVPVVVNTPEIINVPVVVNTPAIINVPVVVNTPEIINVPVVVNTPESVISNQNTAEKTYIPVDVIIKFINDYCINNANANSVNSEIKLNNIDTKDTIKTTIVSQELPVIPIIDSNIVQPEQNPESNAKSTYYNHIIDDIKKHLLFIDNLNISLNSATSDKKINTGVIDSINQKVEYNVEQYNLHLKIYNKRFMDKTDNIVIETQNTDNIDNIDSIVIETKKTDNIDKTDNIVIETQNTDNIDKTDNADNADNIDNIDTTDEQLNLIEKCTSAYNKSMFGELLDNIQYIIDYNVDVLKIQLLCIDAININIKYFTQSLVNEHKYCEYYKNVAKQYC